MKTLNKLKELHAKTTEGPWVNRGDIYIFGVGKMVADIGYDGSVLRARGVGGGMPVDQQVSNLQFCVEAHRLVPRLIEALEKAIEQRNDELQQNNAWALDLAIEQILEGRNEKKV